MATAHLQMHEHPCGTLRVYESGGFAEGSDYRVAITAEIAGAVVVLHGLDKVPRPSEWRAIRACLRGAGFEAVVMLRKGRWRVFNLDQRG